MFYTHSGAVKYDRYLRGNQVKCQLMPVPRKLSSSCGIGARFEYEADVSLIVSEDIERLYRKESGEYQLVYSAE